MKRFVIFGVSALAIAACAPRSVPDSGQGVGFNDYAAYELERAQREAELRGAPIPTSTFGADTGVATGTGTGAGTGVTPGTAAATSAVGAPVGGVSSADLAAAGIGGATQTDALAPAAAAQAGGNAEISDEQDFGAVTSRESIESDAQRRERQAAAYQVIEVTSLPGRDGSSEPNIVQYALQAPNNLGESVFNRSGLNAENRFLRNCAKYRTPDEAQRDFIARGGPQRDRLGLDPDGDGFACGWDPQPFRLLASGGN